MVSNEKTGRDKKVVKTILNKIIDNSLYELWFINILIKIIIEIYEKGSKTVKYLVLRGCPKVGGYSEIIKNVVKRKKDNTNRLFKILKLFFDK